MISRMAYGFLLLMICGIVLTTLVAWTCAMLISPDPAHDGLNPAELNVLRREFFDRAGPDPGGSDPGTLFVMVAHVRNGATFLHVAVEDADLGSDYLRGPLPCIAVTRTGWPWLAMEGRLFHDASRGQALLPSRFEWAFTINRAYVRGNRLFVPRMLPLQPMWPGFVANVVFWALCVALVWFVPRQMRREIRRRNRRCLACGYPIGTSSACTECGSAIDKRQSGVSAR